MVNYAIWVLYNLKQLFDTGEIHLLAFSLS